MSPLEGLGTATKSSGSEPIIEITPDALVKLTELRDAEPDAEGLGLRLELASGPGEDFRYDLSFDEFLKAAFTDEVRTHDGLKVIIPGTTSSSCRARRSIRRPPRASSSATRTARPRRSSTA